MRLRRLLPGVGSRLCRWTPFVGCSRRSRCWMSLRHRRRAARRVLRSADRDRLQGVRDVCAFAVGHLRQSCGTGAPAGGAPTVRSRFAAVGVEVSTAAGTDWRSSQGFPAIRSERQARLAFVYASWFAGELAADRRSVSRSERLGHPSCRDGAVHARQPLSGRGRECFGAQRRSDRRLDRPAPRRAVGKAESPRTDTSGARRLTGGTAAHRPKGQCAMIARRAGVSGFHRCVRSRPLWRV